jgi:subtilisin-like proprotein convertase family protein
MVQAGIAGLATLGWNCRMGLQHQVISSGVDTMPQEATLKIFTPREIGSGANQPRCYYMINGGNTQYLAPSSINGYIYTFTIPGQPFGTTVSYYFAVQDEDGVIIETLPNGGMGVNPPGTQAPDDFFTYFVSPDQIQTICSMTTPKAIPDLSTIYDTIPVSFEGGVKDIDVQVNIDHTRVKSLNLSLIGPDGTQIDLSSGNGGSGSNFTNTIFDDEALTSITSGTAPFTGRYRPEVPLSTFDTKSIYGNWILKIQDSLVSQVGTLNSWCIIANYYDLSAVVGEPATHPDYHLGQNYPNPAKPGLTWIPLNLGARTEIVLTLYDLYGRNVKTLAHGSFEAGSHRISCSLIGLPSGSYIYRLLAGSFSDSRILLLTE